MGWLSPVHRQWMCLVRKWCRLVNLDESLLAAKIFQTRLAQCNANGKTWCSRVTVFFQKNPAW